MFCSFKILACSVCLFMFRFGRKSSVDFGKSIIPSIAIFWDGWSNLISSLVSFVLIILSLSLSLVAQTLAHTDEFFGFDFLMPHYLETHA